MYEGRLCGTRNKGYPCVLDVGHMGQHVSCDGKLRWTTEPVCICDKVDGYRCEIHIHSGS